MSFKKQGEAIEITAHDIQEFNSVDVNPEIIENFGKFASELKRIAPKANDFLYFSSVMMHSAEASLINEDGTPKMTRDGKVAEATWDKSGGTWRWKSNDPSIKAYKNSNGDIFPEEELVRAHKKWIGKPLCIDHKSSSVDHVRGFIVDAHYDRQLKRVVALCALDKCNYPDLARKVATGYSNSVSMGTAVGKAVCYDCGQVARVEADFCKCMRNRTCYGEINVDLNPIELSIVVNGADPLAKIKHVYAAAKNLNDYIERTTANLNKLASDEFQASLSFQNDPGSTTENGGSVNLKATSLSDLKSQVEKAFSDFEKILSDKETVNKEIEDLNHAVPTTFSSSASDTDQNTTPPAARFASSEADGLNIEVNDIKEKLASMHSILVKLAQNYNNLNNEEEIMSTGKKDLDKKAYFNGAGDVNEPTPGKIKYMTDPLQEHLRDKEDRQMFAETNVGPVDKMYKNDEDLETKRMLARAELQDRALKRSAIVNQAKQRLEQTKEAYYLGDPSVDPKKLYDIDKLQTSLREKEDRQMISKNKGVGSIEKMFNNDQDLDLKEKLSRAGLKARFVKAAKPDGSHDLANSGWEVYLGDKLLLTASVDEITGGRSDSLYTAIATKEYGAELIGKVRKLGADKVAAGFSKSAQDVAAATPPASTAPTGELPSTATPADTKALGDVAADKGKEGDPGANALDLAEKSRDLSSDLVEAIRALTGEQAEMGDLDTAKADDSSKVSTASLNSMRKELHGSLLKALKEAHADLQDHEEELMTVASMYGKGAVNASNKDMVNGLVSDVMVEAKQALADSFGLMGAFFKYARGTKAVIKRAQEAAHHGDTMTEQHHEHDNLMAMVDASNEHQPAADSLDAMLAEDMAFAHNDDSMSSNHSNNAEDHEEDENHAGEISTNDPEKAQQMANKGMNVKVTNANTKAGRAAMRAKLAAEMKWNPILQDAHRNLEQPVFDVKPTGDLGYVETIEEKHDVMIDVAEAPPRVRKQAAEIHELVSQGALKSEDIDSLVANGVDPEVVKYYKALYAPMGPAGSQYAAEMVKEHAKAQAEEQMAEYRVKIARAYELATEMSASGIIGQDRNSISNQVDEIMKWNNEGFDSVKRIIASHKPVAVKSAGRMPQVGIIGVSENATAATGDDLASQLALAFSKTSNRMF